MKKILVTGSTDGIGLVTARKLVENGHHVLVHGRNETKLKKVVDELSKIGSVESYIADLSSLKDVFKLADDIKKNNSDLDIIINNAGIYNVSKVESVDNIDVRFAVNTIAPYLLTEKLIPILGSKGRVVNLASAAQAPVDPSAISKISNLSDDVVYAQSKLALIMWGKKLAEELKNKGPVIISVNPKSFLGSKMVKNAYGIDGSDLNIGADILIEASLNSEFLNHSGEYFDNDIGKFSKPHPDALNPEKVNAVVLAIKEVLENI